MAPSMYYADALGNTHGNGRCRSAPAHRQRPSQQRRQDSGKRVVGARARRHVLNRLIRDHGWPHQRLDRRHVPLTLPVIRCVLKRLGAQSGRPRATCERPPQARRTRHTCTSMPLAIDAPAPMSTTLSARSSGSEPLSDRRSPAEFGASRHHDTVRPTHDCPPLRADATFGHFHP